MIVLVDFSSIAFPISHLCASDPNPDATSVQIVAKIRALASGQPHTAICCDSGRSFRNDIAPSYKANRDRENRAALYHRMDLALETLRGDGFPVWAAPGFEADDVIASAVERSAGEGVEVRIVSSDKDLMALVCASVSQQNPLTGNVLDEAGVLAKFGVKPSQMRDYLTIVGDTSDNVPGAKGIGAVGAKEILANFGTLDSAMAQLHTLTDAEMKPSHRKALSEFASSGAMDTTYKLITLRTDAPVNFDEVLAPRVVRDVAPMESEEMDQIDEAMPTIAVEMAERAYGGMQAMERAIEAQQSVNAANSAQAEDYTLAKTGLAVPTAPAPPQTSIATRPEPQAPDVLAPAPAEWQRQLEPRSLGQAKDIAKIAFDSRLFGDLPTAQAGLMKVLAGRELGLQAMDSLRSIHVIENKPTLPADVIRALVLKSGAAKYFRCTERTPTRATFETQRGDDPPMPLTYTIEEGRAAFTGNDEKWQKSGWGKNPADMCVARAGAKLARLVYPDVIHGLYCPEELD